MVAGGPNRSVKRNGPETTRADVPDTALDPDRAMRDLRGELQWPAYRASPSLAPPFRVLQRTIGLLSRRLSCGALSRSRQPSRTRGQPACRFGCAPPDSPPMKLRNIA